MCALELTIPFWVVSFAVPHPIVCSRCRVCFCHPISDVVQIPIPVSIPPIHPCGDPYIEKKLRCVKDHSHLSAPDDINTVATR